MPGPVIEEVNTEEQLMDAIKEQMKLQVRFLLFLSIEELFQFLVV